MVYHPAVSFSPLEQDSFAIQRLGPAVQQPQVPLRLRYHTIYLAEKANGVVQIDDGTYPLGEDQLLLIAKGQVMAFEAGACIKGFVISFGDCFWEKAPASASNCKAILFNNAAANQQLVMDATDTAELLPLFELLYQESRTPAYSNKLDALAAYLKIIMIKIANINASLLGGFDDAEKQLYRRYIELVSTQYKNCHNVSSYAEQLHVSNRRLTEVCQRCSGKGAKEIINGQLMAEARRLLLFSPTPIKEIAYDFNFATPEQFSHFFKKYSAMSPNDYRAGYVHSNR